MKIVALTILATVCGAAPTSACEKPAPIEGNWDPSLPGYIVTVRKEADLGIAVDRLVRKYHLKTRLLQLIHGFMVPALSDDVLEQLRCEPDVEIIGHDLATSIR